MIDEIKLIKFLAREIKFFEAMERQQKETGVIMEMRIAEIKKSVYEESLERIKNDELVEE